jgi:enoyl-CoA hydratase/carnithine racemase
MGDVMSEQSVVCKVVNQVGLITLNRPHVLNSLNLDMVKMINDQLEKWQSDNNVAFVCITGAGEKGLCAGGDMRTFYHLKEPEVTQYANEFFSTEYKMDFQIHEYPKPVLVYMNGIVMGGGVGISIGADIRIVSEKTKWAMPEMNIGFFPDVGASYFLNQFPGNVGRYLALTGAVIKAEDLLYIGAADYYIKSEKWDECYRAIMDQQWQTDSAKETLQKLVNQFASEQSSESAIARLQNKIDEHFSHEMMEDIINSLKAAVEKGDEWAAKTADTILSKPPVSLKVALKQLQKGQDLSLKQCLQMELTLGISFMKNPDFYEGVRAVLVDKDRSPKWNVATLQEINDQQILSYFN